MGFVTYGELIGVFSSDYGPDTGARLDIGLNGMKVFTPASTLTTTTKLRIKRLDGPSVGDVEDTHVVGIFSEDWKYRLDVGDGSLKENTSPTFLSENTQLKIWPAEKASKSGDESKSGQNISYDDVIGVFSEYGDHRLDIGSNAVNPADKNHDSWATELVLHDADPVIEVTKVCSLTYNLKEPKVTTTPREIYSSTQYNSSHANQTFSLGGEYSVEETTTFTNAVSFTLGVTVTAEIGIPFVASGEVEVSAETSYSAEWGEETTTTKTETWQASPVVDARSAVRVLITISDSMVEVPYDMEADVKLLSGKWARLTFPGTFKGHNSSDFTISYQPCDMEGNTTGPATTSQ